MAVNENKNWLARYLKHEGLRVGEIIAYRAWQVVYAWSFRSGDERLHSVYIMDYVWDPDKPASGDVRYHGIYSFRDVIRCKQQYGYSLGMSGTLLFGKVKIWGEIVEHEAGYRSEFARIAGI